jgi:PAS domain S-box-containing protein
MRHGLLEPASLQRMLYDTLDQSDDLVVVLEQSGPDHENFVVAMANDAFCRAIGRSHDELTGQTFASFAAGDGGQDRWAEIMGAVREHRSIRSEMLCSRQSGAPFWLGLHLMPVRGSSPPCFVLLGRDITEALHASQQQAAIQGLLGKVFLCVKAPVAIVSDTGLIHMTNPAMDDLLGYAPGALVGKRAIDCNAPSFRPAAIAAVQRQGEDGQGYALATRLLRADGSEMPVELTSTTMQRDDLRRFRIITVLHRLDGPSATVHVAGKIRLIGLDEVREALGPRWAAVAARAMSSAEHVIRRRCGSHDTWSRTADGGFLICFASATEDEAAFRASAMAREIRTRLIGEGETEAIATVSAIAAAVDVPQVPGRSADMPATVIGERLNSRLAQIEARARDTLRHAVNSTRCRLEPVRDRHTHGIVAHFARLPLEQEQRILAAYSTLPMSERQNFDFDRLVLGVAANRAISDIAEGGGLLVLVNVDFEVFLDRRRTERYVAACKALDNRLRERLILVLSGLPKGVPRSRILDCIMRLRPYCHGIGFQSDSMEPPLIEFSMLAAAIVVLQDTGAAVDTARLAKALDSLHAYQARVLVRHVTSWLAAKPLAQLGVDLVSVVQEERDAES